MFQFPGFASTHYVFMRRYPSLGGLPHSDIHGSTPARGSPWLNAACHVLHRLLVPRHPPNALIALNLSNHHAQEPSTPKNQPGYERPIHAARIHSAHKTLLNQTVIVGQPHARSHKETRRKAEPVRRCRPRRAQKRTRTYSHAKEHAQPPREPRQQRNQPNPDRPCPSEPGPVPPNHNLLRDDRSTTRQPTSHPRTNQPPQGTDRRPRPELVEVDGIEPTTPCLQSRCSPS